MSNTVVYDKLGQPLSVGSPVAWNKLAGRVVSLAPTFVRIKGEGGTVFTRRPWVVMRRAA